MQSAAAYGVAGLSAGALSAIAADAGAIPIAGALVLVMIGLLFRARHWMRLAGRSRVGARSEDEVRRALAPLNTEGWRLRHSLPYRGRGDIDRVAVAPTGITFAIETKTRTFDAHHLASGRFLRPPDRNRAARPRPALRRGRFVDGSTHLVTLDDNGHGHLWDIQPHSWARRACQIAGRTVTRTEWNAALPERTCAPACAAH